MPITPSFGSNTLFIESSPGAGDFAPVELGYGEALVFNGCRCRHYSLANETGKTRVSFNFGVTTMAAGSYTRRAWWTPWANHQLAPTTNESQSRARAPTAIAGHPADYG